VSAVAPLPAEATGLLYEQHHQRIFGFCLSQLGSREDAEDAVQTTFINAQRGLRRGVVPEFELAWLFTIARNVCHNVRDSASRRGRVEAVRDLDLAEHVVVVWARAEEAGHRDYLRGVFDLVVARGFGAPAVTAECGAPFLRVGGTLAVSEPPEDGEAGAPPEASDRWVPAGLARLGLAVGRAWTDGYRYQALDQVEPCPPRYARNPGIPAKRPLF